MSWRVCWVLSWPRPPSWGVSPLCLRWPGRPVAHFWNGKGAVSCPANRHELVLGSNAGKAYRKITRLQLARYVASAAREAQCG
eukprot:344221-Alexandrium_andersonii.AAC.1